jgi:outer membrane protein TolC
VRAVPPIVMLLVAFVRSLPASAQAPAPTPGSSPQPRGSSTSTQAPLPLSTFLGGVPSGEPTSGVITITVVDAIRRALEHNLGLLTADAQLGRAQGARWRALSELLPNVDAHVRETRQQTNLAAFGFGSFSSPFGNIPSIVGPFNVFDARVFLSQTVFDAGAINSARAEAHSVEAARYTYKSARDLVVNVAGTLYVQALAALARVDAARAQQETAQALHSQAVDLKTGGLVAGIDVLRADVQLSTESQRLTTAQSDFEKATLQLARVVGLPLGQRFALDPNLPELPNPDMTLDQAVERAYRERADYQAALERVRAAHAARQAALGEALPSIRVNADYGDIGLSPSEARGTFSVAGAVIIPVFQGGRAHGRLLEAEADLRTRRSEAEDLRASIYYEIRTAFLDLQTTTQQLQVATRARDLAARQLEQARDRFGAGVASNIEVIQGQEAIALASAQVIAAQYGYALAKGALIRGVGTTEALLRQILGGTR